MRSPCMHARGANLEMHVRMRNTITIIIIIAMITAYILWKILFQFLSITS